MALQQYKPTSAGRRFYTAVDRTEVTGGETPKALLSKVTRTGGRNNLGRLTVRSRGGGAKRQYRTIDFKRNKLEIPATVASVQYDPNRSANIALLHYVDGDKRFILAPNGLTVGQTVLSSVDSADILPGNSLPLKAIPMGTSIHNIELKIGGGGKLVRSAGGSAQLVAKEDEYALVRMPSGELRKVHILCRATIGQVGNVEHENVTLGKAGRRRHMGRRPHVRGMAMNPVDHPHGGGEGRSKGGNHPQSQTGVPAKGYKTRKNKRTTRFIVKDRRGK